MKISSIIFISILLLSGACSKKGSSEVSYEQILRHAKILVYKTDSTAAELREAEILVSEIPADAPEYLDGQELIKSIYDREILNSQPTPVPQKPRQKTPTESQRANTNENQNKPDELLQNDSAENSQTETSNKSRANESQVDKSQVKDEFDSKPIDFSETFSIKPGDMKVLGFTFFTTRTLNVQFDASGEDIECYIVSEADFEKLRDKTDFKSFYSSGRVKTGKINLPIKGPFYLVFDNSYSPSTPKTIKASFKALKR